MQRALFPLSRQQSNNNGGFTKSEHNVCGLKGKNAFYCLLVINNNADLCSMKNKVAENSDQLNMTTSLHVPGQSHGQLAEPHALVLDPLYMY